MHLPTINTSPSPSRPAPAEEDKLARESDVTVSTNTTSYAEYKGFFIYVISALALVLYVAWTLMPQSVLVALGISYYPNKYWAHAVPTYLLMLMLFAYVYVALYNTEVKTQKLLSLSNFIDRQTVYPADPAEYVWKASNGVWDLPIGLVNEVLYGDASCVGASCDVSFCVNTSCADASLLPTHLSVPTRLSVNASCNASPCGVSP